VADDAPYIFQFVGDSLTRLTATYAETASSSLATAIEPIAIAGITLVIAVYGGLTIAGKIQQPFTDFVVKSLKVILVAAFALNAGNYVRFVSGSINGLETGLITALQAPGVDRAGNTYAQLDQSIGKANTLVEEAFMQASKKNILTEPGPFAGYVLSGLLIATGIVIFFLVGGAMIICAKFMLSVMLAIGPLFVMTLMWPATSGFFDRWFGQTLTYVFTVVLMSVVMSMGISIFDEQIAASSIDETHPLFMALSILLTSLILAFVTLQVANLAGGISGGISMASLTLRQVAGLVTNPAGAAARRIMAPSNRLDPKTGHQTSSPWAEHFAMGRTVANPRWREAVMKRYSEGWKEGWGGDQK